MTALTPEGLVALQPDRFESVRAAAVEHCGIHGCDALPPTPAEARELAVIARAMRATYVLELGTGFGYAALHIASTFGHTGRIDSIERDAGHASSAETAFQRFALGDRLRVHHGRAAEILTGLNGPYDMAVLNTSPSDYVALHEDVLRLLRAGGALIVASETANPAVETYFTKLGADDRLLASFGAGLRHAIAVRLR